MNYPAKTRYQNLDVVRSYDEKRFSSLKGRIVRKREEAAVLRAFSSLEPGSRILDAPVGTGRFTKLFVEKGFSVVGGDISDEMLKITSELIGDHQKLEKLQKLDLEKMPFSDSEFDMIFTFRLFHHLDDNVKTTILKEIYRVTRKYACISFAEKLSISYLWRVMLRPFRKHDDYNIDYVPNVTKSEMIRLSQDCGFEVISCKSILPIIAAENVLLLKK